MTWYTLHHLTLEVNQDGQDPWVDLAPLLRDLSCVGTHALTGSSLVCLSVHRHDNGLKAPQAAHEVLRVDGFCGLECGEDFYLTDGASLFHLQGWRGRGEAHLAPSFVEKPALRQRNFWAFGLLKLLRPRGVYGLHAAGVVARNGAGLLIVGGSGHGKSTLALGLIRRGWGYLSDDAVLLRLGAEGVEALAFRKPFYINADAASAYPDLPLGAEVVDTFGGQKQRIHVEEVYAAQSVPRCIPRVLLFPRIVPEPHSTLQPLDRPSAVRNLLAQSGPQLFDRGTMARHLDVLTRLVRQSATYELQAGLDLLHDPLTLVRLLAEVEGGERWRVS